MPANEPDFKNRLYAPLVPFWGRKNIDFNRNLGCNPEVAKQQDPSQASKAANKVGAAAPVFSSARTSKTLYWLAISAIVVSIALHSYLASVHYELKFGQEVGHSICNVSEKFNCQAVAASRWSEFLGFPLALWGAVTNLILLCLVAFFPLSSDEGKPVLRTNILILGGFISGMSILMGAISVALLSTYCLFCLFAYLCSFVMFVALYKSLTTPSSGSAVTTSLQGPRYKVSDAKILLFAGGTIVFGTWIANHALRSNYRMADSNFAMEVKNYVQEWLANPQLDIQVVAPLAKGAAESAAKMTIVEFADFRCPHCAHAAPVLEAFVKSRPDVRLLFQTWALDGECNTSMQAADGISCLLARSMVCSAKSGKGWQAHEWLFSHQAEFGSLDAANAQVQIMASAIGVDGNELKACISSEEARKTVEQQAALGTRLNLRGTPTIFVNGRQLPGGQVLPVLQEAYSHLTK